MKLGVAKAPCGCLGHIFFGRRLLEAFADKIDPELKDDGRQRPLISDERG